MASQPPAWLNNAFLEKALNSGKGDGALTVISSRVSPATAPGDNYASEMYKAFIKVKNGNQIEEISVILKTTHTTGQMSEVANDEVFIKEIKAFTKVMPEMQGMLDEVAPLKFPPVAAHHIYSRIGAPGTVIVLEDLKKSGFTLTETTLGLDLQHCLLVIRTIARFHALSMVLEKKDSTNIRSFDSNIFCKEEQGPIGKLFTSYIKTVADEVNKWPEYEKYAKKLYRLSETCMKHTVNGVKATDSSFNVLTHGDLWNNNIMFKYSDETGEVQEVRFVDFQLTHWTSPAVDLFYFLNTTASPDVLLQHYDKIINAYFNALCDTLTLLGHDHLKPTRNTINKELSERAAFAIISATTVRMGTQIDRNNVPDLNKIIKGEATIFLSEEYKLAMKKLLPFYEERGWLKF